MPYLVRFHQNQEVGVMGISILTEPHTHTKHRATFTCNTASGMKLWTTSDNADMQALKKKQKNTLSAKLAV